MWEKATQDYLASRGFADCQWKSNADTELLIPERYAGKLIGDSPELLPLDSSLFSDHIKNVAKLVVYTSRLPAGERFTMATPDEAWRTMVHAWTKLDPERIIADVMRFRHVLDKIIEADGAYVSDKDLRNGHRRAMRRLVRGQERVKGKDAAETDALMEEGLVELQKSWEGMMDFYKGELEGNQ